MDKLIIKVLDKDRNYKTALSREDIAGGVTFSSVVDAGFGNLSLKIFKKFSYAGIQHKDIIVIINGSKNTTSVVSGAIVQDEYYMYQGEINEIERIVEHNQEYISINCSGLQTIIGYKMYSYSGLYSVVRTADPCSIVREIIDLFPTHFSYTTSTIPLYGSNVSVLFSYTDCWSAIKKLIDITGYVFTIDGEGVVSFKPAPTTVDHTLVFKKHITNIRSKEDGTEIINRYLVFRDNAGIPTPVTVDDTGSQALYGVREKGINDSTLKNSSTATALGNANLAKTAYERKNIQIEVHEGYDIATLRVGQLIEVSNSDYNIEGKMIQKIDYKHDSITLYVDSYETIGKKLSKLL